MEDERCRSYRDAIAVSQLHRSIDSFAFEIGSVLAPEVLEHRSLVADADLSVMA
jgi:hypothetical protein